MAIEKDENKQLDLELDKSNNKGGGQPSSGSNKIKDPDDWTTGDEPMTGAQKSYIQTLSGGEADGNMTKSEAAKFIDEHKKQVGNSANSVGGASNAIKDPDDWATGDEAMTDAQRSYLKTLADEAGEHNEENLTKAEASKRIEDLQQKTGRGAS
jgi:hypothetical protein